MKPIWKDKRLVFPGIFNLFITCPVLLDFSEIGFAAKTVFKIRRSHERRDALIQPEVIPVSTSYHVAPPLMSEFVRAEPDILFIGQHSTSICLIERSEATHLLLSAARCQDLR